MATNLSNLNDFFNPQADVAAPIQPAQLNDAAIPTDIPAIMDIAARLNITTYPKLDIKRIIQEIFSITVEETELGKSVSGFLERIGSAWKIYLNRFETEQRKRFTMAHELGHFIKHRDKYAQSGTIMYDQIFFRDENTNPMEREANKFAAELLMPKATFDTLIQEGNNTISKLADSFDLSTSAVRYRAQDLGFISGNK
jgi:predicted transcriptional regulator